MAFPRLKFTKLWTSSTDFPTIQTDETKVRSDMQLLHDEALTGLNQLAEALEKKSAAGELGAVDPEDQSGSTVQALLNRLNEDLKDVSASSGDLPIGGSAGQLLIKSSNNNYDTKWSSAADAGLYYLGLGTAIPSGADLDSYTTVGAYSSASSAITATIKNAPATGAGFRLIVERGYVDAHRIQTVVFGAEGKKFTRYYANSKWSGWKEDVTTSNTATLKISKIASGSYVGTDLYGEDNPNSVTLDFAPKMFLVTHSRSVNTSSFPYPDGYIYYYQLNAGQIIATDMLNSTTYSRNVNPFGGNSEDPAFAKKSEDGKTIYWYATNISRQGNSAGREYFYLAFG